MPAKKNKEPPIDGILVRIEDSQTVIQALGAVKVTEVPTLLRLAAAEAEKRLGI